MAHSPQPRTDRDLLERLRRSPHGKAGYKQLIRELHLGGGQQRRELLEQLDRLTLKGALVKQGDGWALPPSPSERAASSDARGARRNGLEEGGRSGRERLVSGRLELHRDGFGFVRPEVSAGVKGSAEDIFIPPNALNGAMQGDAVLVDEAPPGRDGRRSGRIARVLTRRNVTAVGIFHYAQRQARRGGGDSFGLAAPRGNYVLPLDERLGGPIEIPEGAELISAAIAGPHRTLGETGQRTSSLPPDPGTGPLDPRWPLEGLAVDVEITSFPQPGRPARGRVLEVLGPPDAFGVDVEIVIRKHAIPHTFPADVLAEAEDRSTLSPATLPEDEQVLREDFRGLPIVTIDGETARDFDDAVLVRPLPDGHMELQVHIADVSAYVLPDSPLDTEARVRGTSVYFPDRAVPMLPHALSSGMCSLRPDEDRLVLSCVMQIDAEGEVVGYRVAEGMIRSVRRMTYTGVQHCLNASPAAAEWNPAEPTRKSPRVTPEPSAEDLLERERLALEHPELPEAFDAMLRLALALNRKRVRRGSIDFDLPEPIVQFDPDGNMKAIVRSERGWSHRLIEEFMLSANECIATWLERQGIPSIYRVHERPDPKRILEFEETAAGFGHSLGLGNLPVRKLTMKTDRRAAQRNGARGREHRNVPSHEIPESLPVTPQMYQRLVRRIQGTSEERILAYLMLRSLKQARYAERNDGHFALASPSYTHFTSPIRRYPDLIVHRLVRAMLRRGASPLGGPITSKDRQPWQTELLRTEGRHASQRSASQPAMRLPSRPATQQVAAAHSATQAAAVEADRTRGRRDRTGQAAHIGWSSDDASERVRPREVERALNAAVPEEPQSPAPSLQAAKHSAAEPPIAAEELNDIAVESSQSERRAADAERELIEWKKMKFMADKVGDDFRAIILSVTKHGFFVELDEMFIEGLVPIGSLVGDHYAYRDTDRSICGARTGHCFTVGERVEVILDRIDRQQRRLQFALLPGTEPQATSLRTRTRPQPAKAPEGSSSPPHSAKKSSPKRDVKKKLTAKDHKKKRR